MKTNGTRQLVFFVVIILISTLFIVACTKLQAQTNTGDKWEYMTRSVTDNTDILNNLGNQGWELVIINYYTELGTQHSKMWFKRRK